jgi:hypothetical protein
MYDLFPASVSASVSPCCLCHCFCFANYFNFLFPPIVFVFVSVPAFIYFTNSSSYLNFHWLQLEELGNIDGDGETEDDNLHPSAALLEGEITSSKGQISERFHRSAKETLNLQSNSVKKYIHEIIFLHYVQ